MLKRLITYKCNLSTKYLNTGSNLVSKVLENDSIKTLPVNISSEEEEELKGLQYCAHNHTDTNPFCKELLEKYDKKYKNDNNIIPKEK